jgi:hypothetical protein
VEWQRIFQAEAWPRVLHIVMLQFQNNYYLVEEGASDEKMLYAINNTPATIRRTSGFEMYWSLRRELFDPENRAFVEQLMPESDGPAGELRLRYMPQQGFLYESPT